MNVDFRPISYNATRYLCHDCGTRLEKIRGSKMLRCPRCDKRRRVPTDPFLIVRGSKAGA